MNENEVVKYFQERYLARVIAATLCAPDDDEDKEDEEEEDDAYGVSVKQGD